MWWQRKPEPIPRERLADLESEVRRLRLAYAELEEQVLKWMRRERGSLDRAKALPESNGGDPRDPQQRILARRRHVVTPDA